MKFATVMAFAFFIPTATVAQAPVETRAINELSGELLECSAWFDISAKCIDGSPDAPPNLVPKLQQSAEHVGMLGLSLGMKLGESNDALGAYMGLVTKKIIGTMNNNCLNISVAIARYNDFCAQLVKDSDPRLKELLAGKTCTGSYHC